MAFGMDLLTIGEFARASRLTPKALRLYDELGLLIPACVDPVNGYRRYAPEQLERARLVAWLRRVGMPLARIREVCALAPSQAAEAVRAHWAQVEADTAARRELASFLVDHLTWKDTAMTAAHDTPLRLRYAALSDAGRVRDGNQDTAYAGPRLPGRVLRILPGSRALVPRLAALSIVGAARCALLLRLAIHGTRPRSLIRPDP